MDMDAYLALIPLGLEHAVKINLQDQLAPKYKLSLEVIDELDRSIVESARDQLSTTMKVQSSDQKQQQLLPPSESRKRRRLGYLAATCGASRVVGIQRLGAQGQELSFGYDKNADVWSTKGSMDGLVWLRFETDAPPKIIYGLRFLGPILALCGAWENLAIGSAKPLSDILDTFRDLASDTLLDRALVTWKKHIQDCWALSKDAMSELEERRQEKLRYRLSCMRKDSKKHPYTRQELMSSLADTLIPTKYSDKWNVSLKEYDLEVVVLIRDSAVAIGLCLRPYQLKRTASFDHGRLPPDISEPYVENKFIGSTIRLRPSTAAILLSLAKMQPGELVIDPCVGIGTIAFEALFLPQPVIAMGGDPILTPIDALQNARRYSRLVHHHSQSRGDIRTTPGAAELHGWDGCNLPLRESSTDAVVSDLPFGHKCLSSAKLDQVLPLLLDEMARILRPKTGRIVLLCGAFLPVLEILHESNVRAPNTWLLPCEAVIPVNIGGIQAWIIKAIRGESAHSRIPNYEQRVKKIAKVRDFQYKRFPQP